ncbi:MAG: flagellar hook capping FlgD N-terminal domain-containing protein, partial [Pseudomonadota bacterium]
ETFIKMLTVQMQNQDPLNPLESTEFATQLATFSSVEQQVLTNDLLGDLGAQLSVLGVSQLSGWIGMEGRAHVPAEFNGQPVTITTQGSSLADTHEIVVRDTNGAVVQRFETTGQRQTVAWVGHDAHGNLLPAGTYQIDVESLSQGALINTAPVQVHGRITEARIQDGDTHLVFEGGQEVTSSDILGLREP